MRKPELVKEALKRKGIYKCPERKTKFSAGYDFYCPADVVIPSFTSVVIPTGYKVKLEPDEVLTLHIRSSLAFKKGLRMTNGVGIIDADYYNNPDNEGEILIGVFNAGVHTQVIKKGERFAQGVVFNYRTWGDEPEEERTGGVGSTDGKE